MTIINNKTMDNQQPSNFSQQTSAKDKAHSFFVRSIFYFCVALAVFFALWFVNTKVFIRQSTGYQAVFLTNGQVYFGHLQTNLGGKYVRLQDVYYLQIDQSSKLNADSTTNTDSSQSNFALIKLGNEIHGPKDTMLINQDQILFIEDLRSDSDIVNSINNFEKK